MDDKRSILIFKKEQFNYLILLTFMPQKYQQFKNFDSELQNFSDDWEPDFKLSETEFNKIIQTLF